MRNFRKVFSQQLKIIILAVILSLGISQVFSWSEPLSNPPQGNIFAPINTSSNNQVKGGTDSNGAMLHINGLFSSNSIKVTSFAGNGDKQVCVNNNGELYACSSYLPVVPPTITTASVSGITQTSATSGGTISSNGGATVTVSGIVWSTSPNPTVSLSTKTTNGWATGGPWISQMTSLSPNTTYYVRAYATNSMGTGYGSEVSFKTLDISYLAINLTKNIAGAAAISFSNGYTCPATTATCATTAASGTTVTLTASLNSGYILNSWTGCNSSSGNVCTLSMSGTKDVSINFSTINVPIVSTLSVSNITETSARSGGTISSNGGATVTVSGIVWSTSPNPTVSLSTKTTNGWATGGPWTSQMTSLSPNTTYYVRAYATNSIGTGYGNVLSFKTPALYLAINLTKNIAGAASVLFSSGGGCPDNTATWATAALSGSTVTLTAFLNSGYILNSWTGCNSSSGNTCTLLMTEAKNVSVNFSTATVPTVSTSLVTSITSTSATSGGTISSSQSPAVTVSGIVWSTSPNPTVSLSTKTTNGWITGGPWTSQMTGLNPDTTYYVRAYATNSIGTGYGNILQFKTKKTISIGEYYQGGMIFYVDATGNHGLIAALSNASPRVASWGCHGTLIGGTSTALGTGAANTAKIVAGCSEMSAAKFADNYVSGGYSDWYLPSKDEINLMFTAPGTMPENIVPDLVNGNYWTSSEINSGMVWYKYGNQAGHFNGGVKTGLEGKGAPTFYDELRPIRSF